MVTIASWVVEGRSNVWGGGGEIPNLTNIFPMGWNNQLPSDHMWGRKKGFLAKTGL